MQVLAWRFDHSGDCNRYGNCVDHPYFELPTREEMAVYPDTLPAGVFSLQYVPVEAISGIRETPGEEQEAFQHLREKAAVLRASIGEALHKVQRGHADQVVGILETAAADFDRGWLFAASSPGRT